MASNYGAFLLLLFLLGTLGNSEAENALKSKCSIVPRNGSATCTPVEGGISCDFDCQRYNLGYRHVCTEEKGWNKEPLSCMTDKKDFPGCQVVLTDGVMTCDERKPGELSCAYKCNRSYMVDTLTCSKDRGWDKTLGDCISGVKVNPRCSLALREGAAICQDIGRGEVACVLRCDDHPRGFYHCSPDQGWNRHLPACVSGFKESMCNLVVRNGTAICRVEDAGDVACQVKCADKLQGIYRCKEGHGWDKTLPPCLTYWS